MLLDVLNPAVAYDEALCLLDALTVEVVGALNDGLLVLDVLDANDWLWFNILYSPARIAGLYLGCIAALEWSEVFLEGLRIGEVECRKLGVLDVHRVEHGELGSVGAVHLVDAALDAVGAVGDISAAAANSLLEAICVDEDVLCPLGGDALVVHIVVGEVLVRWAVDEGIVCHIPDHSCIFGAPNLVASSVGSIREAEEVVARGLVGVVEGRVLDLDVFNAVGTIVPTDDGLALGIVVLHDG